MDTKINIVLVGFMGCGKTCLGKKLSRRLKCSFVDTDKLIELKEGINITAIFASKGEEYFRDAEKKMIEKISEESNNIISTGGGIIKNPQNMENLKKNGVIVYLRATPRQIFKNIGDDNTRPLLQGGDKMQKITSLMAERVHIYEKYADVTVDVGGEMDLVVNNIIKEVRCFEKNLYNTRPKP